MDEPNDAGVMIEVMYAKKHRIPVIGYRADMKTPNGGCWNCGMNMFPFLICDHFIE